MRSPVLSANRDNLVTKDIIRKVEISVLPDVEVYQSLIDALKSEGDAPTGQVSDELVIEAGA